MQVNAQRICRSLRSCVQVVGACSRSFEREVATERLCHRYLMRWTTAIGVCYYRIILRPPALLIFNALRVDVNLGQVFVVVATADDTGPIVQF